MKTEGWRKGAHIWGPLVGRNEDGDAGDEVDDGGQGGVEGAGDHGHGAGRDAAARAGRAAPKEVERVELRQARAVQQHVPDVPPLAAARDIHNHLRRHRLFHDVVQPLHRDHLQLDLASHVRGLGVRGDVHEDVVGPRAREPCACVDLHHLQPARLAQA
eukprot:156262-Rhodomonas_salina.1